MANPEHVEIVKQGAEAILEWWAEHMFGRLDLRKADLFAADVTKANLRGANLREAVLGCTIFGNLDLSVAKELESTRHEGPSTVGVDTLALSQGKIPAEFLRGCGFTSSQILDAKLYDPALTAVQIRDLQFRVFDERTRGPPYIGGVFISYSRADAKFVDKMYQRLGAEGIPTWLDRHDMVAGPLQKQVSRAIRINDVVLLVLSKSSINSDWVENELDMARRKEKDEVRDVLCPVALDDAWKSKVFGSEADDRALWRTLTHKNILDFSAGTSFDGQFNKLLRGMKIYYEPQKS